MAFTPSDLTAHALGEPLPPEIRREVENALATDPAARAEAAATREMEASLRAAFAADLGETVSPVRRRVARRPGSPTWLYVALGAAALLSLSALVFPALRPAPVVVSATPSVEELRARLAKNELPRPESVRVGELVTYFSPQAPASQGTTVELVSAPWNPRHRLLRLSGGSASSFEVSLAPGQVESFRVLTSENVPAEGKVLLDEGVSLCEIIPSANAKGGQILLNLKGNGSSQAITVADVPVSFAEASPEMRLTTAVAAYGLLLKNAEKAPLSLTSIRKVAGEIPAHSSLKSREFFKLLEASQPLMR